MSDNREAGVRFAVDCVRAEIRRICAENPEAINDLPALARRVGDFITGTLPEQAREQGIILNDTLVGDAEASAGIALSLMSRPMTAEDRREQIVRLRSLAQAMPDDPVSAAFERLADCLELGDWRP